MQFAFYCFCMEWRYPNHVCKMAAPTRRVTQIGLYQRVSRFPRGGANLSEGEKKEAKWRATVLLRAWNSVL